MEIIRKQLGCPCVQIVKHENITYIRLLLTVKNQIHKTKIFILLSGLGMGRGNQKIWVKMLRSFIFRDKKKFWLSVWVIEFCPSDPSRFSTVHCMAYLAAISRWMKWFSSRYLQPWKGREEKIRNSRNTKVCVKIK